MKAHNNGQASRFGPITFSRRQSTELDGNVRPDAHETCSYCGSLSIDEAMKAFQTPGTKWSGSDWKYGWPHKFYLEIPCEPYRKCVQRGPGENEFGYGDVARNYHKFYTEHLIDATPEQLEEWNRAVKPITGVSFQIVMDGDEEVLRWDAPRHGYQGDGVIQ